VEDESKELKSGVAGKHHGNTQAKDASKFSFAFKSKAPAAPSAKAPPDLTSKIKDPPKLSEDLKIRPPPSHPKRPEDSRNDRRNEKLDNGREDGRNYRKHENRDNRRAYDERRPDHRPDRKPVAHALHKRSLQSRFANLALFSPPNSLPPNPSTIASPATNPLLALAPMGKSSKPSTSSHAIESL
jgi:hypothetical protein